MLSVLGAIITPLMSSSHSDSQLEVKVAVVLVVVESMSSPFPAEVVTVFSFPSEVVGWSFFCFHTDMGYQSYSPSDRPMVKVLLVLISFHFHSHNIWYFHLS